MLRRVAAVQELDKPRSRTLFIGLIAVAPMPKANVSTAVAGKMKGAPNWRKA
jgi:hypothetical protein